MEKQVNYPALTECVCASEHSWLKLCRSIRPSITMYVYTSNVPTWHGQEQELVEDIIQETMLRLHCYMHEVECGNVPPINCLEAFCHTIARNYYRDLRRKETRLTRLPTDSHELETALYLSDTEDPLDETLDEMLDAFVIVTSARVIASFPEKQRTALLTNLAHYSDFDDEPTALQKALLHVGIRLSDYLRPLSLDPVERGRHNTLVSIAYKRLKSMFRTEHYGIVA